MPKTSDSTLHNDLRKTNRLLSQFVSYRQAFIRGMFTGLGGVLGATILLTVLLWLLSQLSLVPIIGNFASQVIEVVQNQTGTSSTK